MDEIQRELLGASTKAVGVTRTDLSHRASQAYSREDPTVQAATPFGSASPPDFLQSLGETNRRRVIETARRQVLPAGAITEYPRPVFVGDLVQEGMIRVFQGTADGREATVRYAHRTHLVGLLPADAFRHDGPVRAPFVYLQALEKTTLLHLDARLVRELYETDLEVAQAIAANAASVLVHVVRVVTVRTLGSVREKLAFDLLERACREQLRTGRLDIPVTHDSLANGIGATRETVSRILAELRSDGIISTSQGHILVAHPRKLSDMMHGLVM